MLFSFCTQTKDFKPTGHFQARLHKKQLLEPFKIVRLILKINQQRKRQQTKRKLFCKRKS